MMAQLTDEEKNLRLMEEVDKYADWQFDTVKRYIHGSVLEVGAGTGTMTARLVSHPDVKSCTATEISQNNLSDLRQRFGSKCKVSEGNLESSVPKGFEHAFDTVFSANVMEHVKDDHSFFRNCCRCLKSGGRIVFMVPAMRFLYGTVDEVDSHFRRYERYDLISLAHENAMKTERLFHMNLPGAAGWYYHGKLLKVQVHERRDLRMFNMIVPFAKAIEGIIPPPIGLSLVFVARKP